MNTELMTLLELVFGKNTFNYHYYINNYFVTIIY